MRLTLRKTLVRPVGGHHFIENRVMMRGETLEELVGKITDYRLNNSISIGEPEQEVLQFYTKNWPYMVDEEEDSKPLPPPDKYKVQWIDWVRRQWGKTPSKAATVKEAEIRWKVCLDCPYNLPLESLTREEEEIMRKAFMLRRGHETPKKLGFCALHLWDNSSAVFIEAPSGVSGMKKDTVRYPKCWVA